jgi:hypothetical protein
VCACDDDEGDIDDKVNRKKQETNNKNGCW